MPAYSAWVDGSGNYLGQFEINPGGATAVPSPPLYADQVWNFGGGYWGPHITLEWDGSFNKGDLLVGLDDGRLRPMDSSGNDGDVLTVNTALENGLQWAASTGGGAGDESVITPTVTSQIVTLNDGMARPAVLWISDAGNVTVRIPDGLTRTDFDLINATGGTMFIVAYGVGVSLVSQDGTLAQCDIPLGRVTIRPGVVANEYLTDGALTLT